jgi:Kef-type K+ transport system membrane component KefB
VLCPHDRNNEHVTDYLILRSLGYILFTAAAAVLLLRFIRVPTILAYMVAGLLLGPIGGVITATDSVELIAETGIALLLFLVGLELSLDKIRGVGRYAIVGGTLQILITAAVGFGAALVFGLRPAAAAVIALGVTFSSTVVVVKLLGQKHELSTLYGRTAVGILLVQDVAVVLALTLFAGLQTTTEEGVGSVLRGVVSAFGGMFALAAAAAMASRWLLPHLFLRVRTSPDTMFIWSLAWCFLFIVAAEVLHLSVELGAFIAGVSLAQLHFAEVLRRRVQPIVNFFLAVFFVSLGLHMDPAEALGAWPLVLVLMLTVLIIKPAIMLATLPRLGLDSVSAFRTSVTLAQMSEFSFILAALAAAAGVIGDDVLSAISLAGFVTIGISSYVITGSAALHETLRGGRLLRFFRADGGSPAEIAPELTDHIIVIGMNTLGQRIVWELRQRGRTVLAIDTDPAKLMNIDTHVLLGTVDDAGVLEEANFAQARLVISALQIEDTNNLLTYRCRLAGVPISVHAYDEALIADLRELGADHIMVSKHDGAREIAVRLREAGVLD